VRVTAYDERCAFCRIATGEEEPPELIAKGESWMAFFPLQPATPGHTLVIPYAHLSNLWEVGPPLDAELMRAAISLGNAIRAALAPDGMNLITSAGRTAEQSVFHLHLHLVPRWDDDGFGEIWPVERTYSKSGLADTGAAIRGAYQE
jgi:histidine triad (HIT) family protein